MAYLPQLTRKPETGVCSQGSRSGEHGFRERREVVIRLLALSGGMGLVGCGSVFLSHEEGAMLEWARPMQGTTVALLGEVHDNAELHQLRLKGLREAVAAGWRPALVMEQFDLSRQIDLDRARHERSHNPRPSD